MDVTDVLRDRMAEPGGFERMARCLASRTVRSWR